MRVGETIQSSQKGMFNHPPDRATERIVTMFATASATASSRTAARNLSAASLTLLLATAHAWAVTPAAGEVSAVDTPPTATLQSTVLVKQGRPAQPFGPDAAHRVNGELPPAVQMATPDGADARAVGRMALRAGTLQVGDASL